MLRLDDKIRLTSNERAVFDAVVGTGQPAPKTVQEHDEQLTAAAEAFEAGDSPEERLAAALARDLLIG